jgi:hypothetical protein
MDARIFDGTSVARPRRMYASFAPLSSTSPGRRSIEAELAYVFDVEDADLEIDEELSAALEPLDD